jgi:hypothetical protein
MPIAVSRAMRNVVFISVPLEIVSCRLGGSAGEQYETRLPR